MDGNIWSLLDRAGNLCSWTPHMTGFNCFVLWQGMKNVPHHQDLRFASHCWETLCRSWLTLPLGTTTAELGTAVRLSETNCNAITTESITSPSPPLLSELLLAVRQKLITRALQCVFQASYQPLIPRALPGAGSKFICYYLPRIPVPLSTMRISNFSYVADLHLARQKQISAYSGTILFQSGDSGLLMTL